MTITIQYNAKSNQIDIKILGDGIQATPRLK